MIRKWIPLWVIPFLIGMSILTVWLRTSYMIDTTRMINQADQEIKNLQKEKEQLALKVAGLRSPKRLEVLAKTKFGLTQPRADQVVHLK